MFVATAQTLNDMTRSMTAPLVHIKKLAKASNVKVGFHFDESSQIYGRLSTWFLTKSYLRRISDSKGKCSSAFMRWGGGPQWGSKKSYASQVLKFLSCAVLTFGFVWLSVVFLPVFKKGPKISSITGFRTGYIIHVYTGLQDTSKWIFRRKASNRSLRSGSIKDNDGADLPKVQVLLLSKSMSIKWIRWILTFGTHKCI